MKNYKEQYLNPQWQKKRLEILERASWRCELCKDKEKTLHVHHRAYISGNDVWDYPNEYLVCLCKDCHESEGAYLKEHLPRIVELLKLSFFGENLEPFSWGLENIEVSISPQYVADRIANVLMYMESQRLVELSSSINQYGKNEFMPNIVKQMEEYLITLEKENNNGS